MKKDNQLIVVKANELIQQFSYDLSETEWDLFDYLVAQIKSPFGYDKEFNEIEFYIPEYFKQVYGVSNCGGSQKDQIIKSIYSIEDKKTEPITLTTGKYKGYQTKLRLISKSYINQKTGHVILKLDNDLKPFLLELNKDEGNYTMYMSKFKARLSSKYSRRLYEILKSNENLKDGFYPSNPAGLGIDDLKKMLKIPSSYRFNNIKERILEESLDDINRNTDLNVSYKERKKGRKVIGISFKIEKQKDPLREVLDVEYKESNISDSYLILFDYYEGIKVEYIVSLINLIHKNIGLLKELNPESDEDELIEIYIKKKLVVLQSLNIDKHKQIKKFEELVKFEIVENQFMINNKKQSNESKKNEESNKEVEPIENHEINEFYICVGAKTQNQKDSIMNLVDQYLLDKYGEVKESFKNQYLKLKMNDVENAANIKTTKVAYVKGIIRKDIQGLQKNTEKKVKQEQILPEWYLESKKEEEKKKEKNQELKYDINNKTIEELIKSLE